MDDQQQYSDQNSNPSQYAVPGDPPSTTSPTTVYSGLSGNELYCLYLLNYKPGNLLVGNSVYAMGFLGSELSKIRTTVGGEIKQFTNIISEGRRLSIQRLEQELSQCGGQAATGVTSELIFHPGNVEFLSVGSAIHGPASTNNAPITSSSDGQEFYCQVDSGYTPLRFVFGNVAYSIGLGKSLIGNLRELEHGEIKQFSDIFNTTRNLALERLCAEAKAIGANSVIGIRTTILSLGVNGVQEMLMVGTASYNQQVANIADSCGGVLTSDMTAEENWNITRIGYVPLKLILGTSVYSLGVVGNIRAAMHSFVKGELTTLTQLIYGAREESLKKVQQQAEEIGADDVLGIKTYIYQLDNNVIEFLAVGTAVKRVEGTVTRSDQLPPQAIIRDKNTFINTADQTYGTTLNHQTVDPAKQAADPNIG
jgi:uncharacterized protein YbjQ (UPF0145 family)